MTRIVARTAGAVALSAALAFVFAPASRAGGPHGPARGLEPAVEALDLDGETRGKAFALIDAARPRSRELHESLRGAREELRALLEQPEASEAAVLAQVDAIGALRTELEKHDVRTLVQVRALLSPEQRAALAEAMQRHPHRGHGRHDGGRRVL
jgi:Spy/CpxP family protein refolding chaperone